MSRKMLHGVLRMPVDCWSDCPLDKRQRHARYYQASEVIEGQDAAIKELEEQRKVLQNLLANYACQTGAGANDPNVIEALSFGDDEDFED
ncbi:hypothetical protein JR728_003710 [Vibrio vulnificus]|nr:hypothetical protein [Vibrio vulnificus]